MPDSETQALQNWAGNLLYGTSNVFQPETLEEVRELVSRLDSFRVLGSRHSFNEIANCSTNLISLEQLDQVVELDTERRTVTIEGGMRYGPLCQFLHENGYALPNLASLPHISVAGACATATHGSGNSNGNLATPVSGIEMITTGGEVVSFSRDEDPTDFPGTVVGLGALGLISKLTLDLLPTFEVAQTVYRNLPLAQLLENFDDIASQGYSVSFFTRWQEDNISQVWIKRRSTGNDHGELDTTVYGAALATENLRPVGDSAENNCTEQIGIPGPWHERLPHFKMEFTPSHGEELQSEYFVLRQHALSAIEAINGIGSLLDSHLLISEIRTIAADDLWMSPCYQQDSVAIHFTWKRNWPEVRPLLSQIEKALAPFDARPHWGKLFTTSPELVKSFYPKRSSFCDLAERLDPKQKLRNEFLNTFVFD